MTTGEGKDMVIRDKIFSTITNVFKRHGAVTIDTLVFYLSSDKSMDTNAYKTDQCLN